MNNTVTASTVQTASSYRWVILALASASFLFTFVTRFSWPPLIPVMRPIFNFSAAEAGSFMSAFYFGYIITQVPAGILSDRLGPRFILAGSLIIPGIMMFMMQYMTGYSSGFWMRFVIGLAAGADMAAASRALTEWFPAKERAVAWGILMAAPSAGLLLPNFVVPAINSAFGWQAVFEIIGGISIVIGILVLCFLRTSDTAQKKAGNPFGGLKIVFTSKSLIMLSLIGFSLMWAELGLATWANAYFKQLGFSMGASGTIMVAYGCGAVLAPLTSVYWARLFGKMRRLIIVAFLCQIPLTLIFGQIQQFEILLGLGFVLGYVSYMVNSPLNILVTDVAGKEWAGSAIGTTNFIYQFASMLCPLVVGWSIDFTGTFGSCWFIVAAGSLVGMVLMTSLKIEETEI